MASPDQFLNHSIASVWNSGRNILGHSLKDRRSSLSKNLSGLHRQVSIITILEAWWLPFVTSVAAGTFTIEVTCRTHHFRYWSEIRQRFDSYPQRQASKIGYSVRPETIMRMLSDFPRKWERPISPGCALRPVTLWMIRLWSFYHLSINSRGHLGAREFKKETSLSDESK